MAKGLAARLSQQIILKQTIKASLAAKGEPGGKKWGCCTLKAG